MIGSTTLSVINAVKTMEVVRRNYMTINDNTTFATFTTSPYLLIVLVYNNK
jgi:hypothetical protein